MLVLSLALGAALYVGDVRVVLVRCDGGSATLKVGGHEFVVGDRPTRVPGLQDVRMVVRRAAGGRIRIGVQAPIEVKVLRERLYLEDLVARTEPRPPNRFFAWAVRCRTCRGRMMVKDQTGRWVPCRSAGTRSICGGIDLPL